MSSTVLEPVGPPSAGLDGLLRTHLYAGSIGSGPWVVSILAILAIARFRNEFSSSAIVQFQVIVTYLIASSLTLAGPLQLLFARYASDRVYQGHPEAVVPNLFGALLVMLLVAAVIGTSLLPMLPGSILVRVTLVACFATLCAVWVATVFVSAIKAPLRILAAFSLGYCLSAVSAIALQNLGLEGLLVGFMVGQGVLLFVLLTSIKSDSAASVSFDFFLSARLYPTLLLTGLLYPAALWCDKVLFWYNPLTSDPVFGVLRASPIYDTPIFLAYLSIIPGMTVFQMRMDNDVARYCSAFYRAIERGASLHVLKQKKQALIISMRETLAHICKVQAVATLVLIVFSGDLLAWFGMSAWYRQLLNVDLFAAGIQLFFLAILNLLFFLDKRRSALALCAFFVGANVVFTLATQYLGPEYYGFGFALAAMVSVIGGLVVLSRTLESLEYETFMLQQAAV